MTVPHLACMLAVAAFYGLPPRVLPLTSAMVRRPSSAASAVSKGWRLIGMAVADGGISAAVLDINLDGRHVRPVADRLAALGVPLLFATGDGDGCDTGGPAFRGRGAAPPR